MTILYVWVLVSALGSNPVFPSKAACEAAAQAEPGARCQPGELGA